MNEQQKRALENLAGQICDHCEGTRALTDLDMHAEGLQAYININAYQSWLLPTKQGRLAVKHLYKQGGFGSYVAFMPADAEEVAQLASLVRQFANERASQATLDRLEDLLEGVD